MRPPPEIIPRLHYWLKVVACLGHSLIYKLQSEAALVETERAKRAAFSVSWIRRHTFTFSGRKIPADALAFAGVLFPSDMQFRYLSSKENLREAGK